MSYNPDQRFHPGRLFITCKNAENIRCRADHSNNGTLTPHLLFKLPSNRISLPPKQSRIGFIRGYNVTFDEEVVCFDIAEPNQLLVDGDATLIIQLRDNLIGLIGQCQTVITGVLSSPGVEVTKSFAVLKPGDTSTNSRVNLQLAFVEAKPGLLKLDLCSFKDSVENNRKRNISVSSSDGQCKTSSLSDSSKLEGGFSFWVNEMNWFEEISLEIYDEGCNDVIGEGKVSVLNCLKYDKPEMSESLISVTWDKMFDMPTSKISMRHSFLAAGIVKVKDITMFGVGAVANPRVFFKTIRMTYVAEKPTSITASTVLWEDELFVPVVSETSLSIDFGGIDNVTGQFESVGRSELSLLPLYKSSRLDASVELQHEDEILGEILACGKLSMSLVFLFQGPSNVAFPRDQSAVQSYLPGDRDTVIQSTNSRSQCQGFSEVEIRHAFNKIDLDKNGYIGAAELRHCLICMGQHPSDAEVDMMISMLDTNGDGQVSFKAFKALVESPDPVNDDFSYMSVSKQASRVRDDHIMQEAFCQYVKTRNIVKADVLLAWDSLRRSRSALSLSSDLHFRMRRDQLSVVMPRLGDPVIADLLIIDSDEHIDGRELLMCFSTVVDGFSSEEKCKLAFDMFDVDGAGYFSIDQIEALLTCTHFSKRETLRKKADILMRLVGGTIPGGVSIEALVAGANKFPGLIFPNPNI